jgi:BASS family bile acid:Na+ symporter
MTTNEFFTAIAQLAGVLFVIPSMVAMGLSLTIPQIIQPLKNIRLVLLALLGNFVLVPMLAYAITRVIPLEQSLQVGLAVLATAAGAPFLPKLAQGAKGNMAFSVGLMTLLMAVTVLYVPLVLPILLPGVEINPWDIAKSLIMSMLVPLSIGLLIKAHSPDSAEAWAVVMNKISSLAILVLMVVALGLNISNIINMIGSGGILALLLFIVGSLLIGSILGGSDPAIRSVMGLGTAQRNIAAAILITAQNFSEGNTLSLVLVASILLLLILLPTAKRLGSRSSAVEAAVPPEAVV